jgi:hypothetical protein
MFLLATALIILFFTLVPGTADTVYPEGFCVYCGERAGADAILNVFMFGPFGMALALRQWRFGHAVLLAMSFSSVIEFTQLFIPGRDANLGDILANTVGAGLAVYLVRTARHWMLPRAHVQGQFSFAAGFFAVGTILTGAYLTGPALPRSTYFGQWTPNLQHLEWYRGRVLSASIGNVPLPSQQLADSRTVRDLLLAGTPLSLEVVAGPRPQYLGSLFSIADGSKREVILVGVERDDLVVRYRTRSVAARLDQPAFRLDNAFGDVTVGDTVHVTAWREGRGYCVRVNTSRFCPVGFTAGRSRSVFLSTERLPTPWQQVLDALWMALLMMPLGFWTRKRWESMVPLGIAFAALAVVPATSGLLAPPAGEWVGALLGLGAGIALQSFARSTRAARGEGTCRPA